MSEVTIKDPQGKIEKLPNGFAIVDHPVEFRYLRDYDGGLDAALAVVLLGDDELVVSAARTHPLDKGKASRVRGRSIAAARMWNFLVGTRDCKGIMRFIKEDTVWFAADPIDRVDFPFWNRFNDEYLDRLQVRLSKRN